MSPPPLITPAPVLPARLLHRQTSDDPYGLNSLYAALSDLNSLLAQYSYSYSEFDYSSFYASYLAQNSLNGYDDLSSLLDQLTAPSDTRPTGATGLSRPDKPDLRPTNTDAASSKGSDGADPQGQKSGGLSSGAKIGIAVAVPLAVLLLAGVGIFLWCAGKRKGKKSSTTIIAPNVAQVPPPPQFQPPQFQPQPQGYPPSHGYLPGYQQPPQFVPSPPPQFVQVPPQYSQGQAVDPNALGAYAKGPPQGVVEMETEYHFARGGAVEIGDSEPKAPEKKGPSWRKMVGGGSK